MKIEISHNENYLSIEPLRYVPATSECGYLNLILTKVVVNAGKFYGEYNAEFENADFENFKKGLVFIYDNLNAFAGFDSLDPYLTLKIQGDGLGHFQCECKAIHNPGFEESELTFILHFDQTQIPAMINQIDLILTEYKL